MLPRIAYNMSRRYRQSELVFRLSLYIIVTPLRLPLAVYRRQPYSQSIALAACKIGEWYSQYLGRSYTSPKITAHLLQPGT